MTAFFFQSSRLFMVSWFSVRLSRSSAYYNGKNNGTLSLLSNVPEGTRWASAREPGAPIYAMPVPLGSFERKRSITTIDHTGNSIGDCKRSISHRKENM